MMFCAKEPHPVQGHGKVKCVNDMETCGFNVLVQHVSCFCNEFQNAVILQKYQLHNCIQIMYDIQKSCR